MTNAQLYLAIAVPLAFNGLTTVLLYVLLTKRIDDMQAAFTTRIDDVQAAFNKRIDDVAGAFNQRLSDMQRAFDQRLDAMTVAWQESLHRVEQVVDARLKALEERGGR